MARKTGQIIRRGPVLGPLLIFGPEVCPIPSVAWISCTEYGNLALAGGRQWQFIVIHSHTIAHKVRIYQELDAHRYSQSTDNYSK
jgi:hypothetical protein